MCLVDCCCQCCCCNVFNYLIFLQVVYRGNSFLHPFLMIKQEVETDILLKVVLVIIRSKRDTVALIYVCVVVII